jgi:outer membrane murein-binding lipoprotein Lpp
VSEIVDVKVYTAAQSDERFQARGDYATKADVAASTSPLSGRVDALEGKVDAAASKEQLADYATTVSVAQTYVTKSEMTTADHALGVRIDGLSSKVDAAASKEQLGAYLTRSDAEATYATKRALVEAQLGGGGKEPDLSGFATKQEMQSADSALSGRIDGLVEKVDAAATKAELAGYLSTVEAATTYATKQEVTTSASVLGGRIDGLSSKVDAAASKEQLDAYLTTEAAGTTYATKADTSSADTALGKRIDGLVEKVDAAATKEQLAAYLTSEAAGTTYATKQEVTTSASALGGRIDGLSSKVDAAATREQLGAYLTTEAAGATYATKSEVTSVSTSLGARVDAMRKSVDLAVADQSPFRRGARYYSPASYWWPDFYLDQDDNPDTHSKWGQLLTMGDALGIVVLNRNSGDWSTFDKDFKEQGERALSAGARRCVFYIKTQYAVATLPEGDKAREGVPDAGKYTKEYILSQVKNAHDQYPGVCQGVFLDETINGWGEQASRVPFYQDLVSEIRRLYGKQFLIVCNAGSNISEAMVALDVDVYMTYEGTAEKFLKDDPASPLMPAHMASQPSIRWWAVVHDTTQENYQQVFARAESLGYGHLYVTDGKLVMGQGGQWNPDVNPYQNPPSSWIQALLVPWIKGYLALYTEVLRLREAAAKVRLLVLGKNEQIPAGTPSGTVIVRKER